MAHWSCPNLGGNLHSNLQKLKSASKPPQCHFRTIGPWPTLPIDIVGCVEGMATGCSQWFGEHCCAFVAFDFALSPKQIASSHHLQMGVDWSQRVSPSSLQMHFSSPFVVSVMTKLCYCYTLQVAVCLPSGWAGTQIETKNGHGDEQIEEGLP